MFTASETSTLLTWFRLNHRGSGKLLQTDALIIFMYSEEEQLLKHLGPICVAPRVPLILQVQRLQTEVAFALPSACLTFLSLLPTR